MKPSKPLIIALTLMFVLLGVPSLVGKNADKSRIVHKPDAGDAHDPGPFEGDPWQDDDGGGLNLTSGGRTHILILPSISFPFEGFRVLFVKVYPQDRMASDEVSITKNTSTVKMK